MPILTIDNNTVTAQFDTPLKTNIIEVSTPETDLDVSGDNSSSDSVSDSCDSNEFEIAELELKMNQVAITEHRKLELGGKLKPEPLLVDNPGRFVLFPIQNPEVCYSLSFSASNISVINETNQNLSLSSISGLGNVQKSRGFLLDCGRD